MHLQMVPRRMETVSYGHLGWGLRVGRLHCVATASCTHTLMACHHAACIAPWCISAVRLPPQSNVSSALMALLLSVLCATLYLSVAVPEHEDILPDMQHDVSLCIPCARRTPLSQLQPRDINTAMQDGVAYALIVLLGLLQHKSTLYLVLWAKPVGMASVRDAVSTALQELDSWHIPDGSLLMYNLAAVHNHMSSKRFRRDQREVLELTRCCDLLQLV